MLSLVLMCIYLDLVVGVFVTCKGFFIFRSIFVLIQVEYEILVVHVVFICMVLIFVRFKGLGFLYYVVRVFLTSYVVKSVLEYVSCVCMSLILFVWLVEIFGSCLTNGIVKIVCICDSLNLDGCVLLSCVCLIILSRVVYFLFISLGMILVIQYFVKSFSNQVKFDFEFFTSIVFRSWSHILKNRVIFSLYDITVVLLVNRVYVQVDSDLQGFHVCCILVELIRSGCILWLPSWLLYVKFFVLIAKSLDL
ncbi:hypothetical protein Hanom_Chr07g00586031 [Helianthus anomalus]